MDVAAVRDILSEILQRLKILEIKIDIQTQGFATSSQLSDLGEHRIRAYRQFRKRCEEQPIGVAYDELD